MKLVVVGRGLAAMGLLWNMIKEKKKVDEIYWIGPFLDPKTHPPAHFCSLNTTALVALQGIKKDLSALGDSLYEAFFLTREFIEEYTPAGVQKVDRFHLVSPGEDNKIRRRFGALQAPASITSSNFRPKSEFFHEEAYIFEPQTFLSWWQDTILSQLNITLVDDLVTTLDDHRISTLKGETYCFDRLALCTGALESDLNLSQLHKIPKVAVGHYFHFSDITFVHEGPRESLVLTWKGHNFIYNQSLRTLVWGGSTYSDGITAKREKDLKDDLEDFISVYPELKFTGKKSIRTGVRSKGPKRAPILKWDDQRDILILNGLYKNGWSLSHLIGKKAILEIGFANLVPNKI